MPNDVVKNEVAGCVSFRHLTFSITESAYRDFRATIMDEAFVRPEAMNLVVEARRKVTAFDAIDHESGHQTSAEAGVPDLIKAVREAIAARLNTGSTECFAEAFVMLDNYVKEH